jgi:hypothetical protein
LTKRLRDYAQKRSYSWFNFQAGLGDRRNILSHFHWLRYSETSLPLTMVDKYKCFSAAKGFGKCENGLAESALNYDWPV